MKKKLLKLLNSKTEARKALSIQGETCEDIKELRSINSQVEALNSEINELREMIDEIDCNGEGNHPAEGRSTQISPQGGFNPLSSYVIGSNKRNRESVDMEYRNAFMNHVLKGTKISEELRSNVTTLTTDIGELIPKNVLDKIIEKLRFYGNIFSRITVTNIKGGVTVPTSSAKPIATWVGEGKVSDKQKKTIDGTVTFSYHKLQCRVAVSLEADTTSLPIFESAIIDNVSEAMIVAIEQAIISGTGVKQPLGIINDTKIKSTQKIAVKPSELTSWEKWSKIFAKVPLSKRAGTVLIMNNETYEGDILGMVDVNGQPIARTTYGLDGTESYRFKGKEVVPVEDYLTSYDAAQVNDVFGIIVNLKDYMFNSNLQIMIKRYFDEDTDEWITKSTTIADGKLADAQGVILLTKANEE
jgi:HK97 family phage major capsid protein